ncbi:SET domain protein, partial [Teladorsagia circumcincta]
QCVAEASAVNLEGGGDRCYSSLELEPELAFESKESQTEGEDTTSETRSIRTNAADLSDSILSGRVRLNLVRDSFIWQLTAGQPIPKDTIIMPLYGQVVDQSVARVSLFTETEAVAFASFIALPDGKCLDRRLVWDLSRFITHSCDPNCGVKPTGVRSKQFCIYAKLDIEPDDVITVDMYRMFAKTGKKYTFDDHLRLVREKFDHVLCNCGTKACRQILWEETLPDGPIPLSKLERMSL